MRTKSAAALSGVRARDCVAIATLALALAHVQAGRAQTPRRADVPLLPAYAHNDYENERPLLDALALGYRGVEADYYVVDGALLVGHDREDLRAERTLESMYLAPLRQHVETHGTVCADGTTFTLNIESKEVGAHTYEALHALLRSYAEILTVVRDGTEVRGPVQIVLVGWHPPFDELARQEERFVSVQAHFEALPEDHARHPSHLLRMVSVEYKTQFSWRGGAHVPRQFDLRVAKVLAARDAVPGRIVRVFRVPRSRSVYRALVDAGVDLIGTKTIHESHDILLQILRGSSDRSPTWNVEKDTKN